MTISSSSSEASSETSETGKSSGDPSVRKPWCRWLPRSYLLVFVINATATVLLWPADVEFPDGWYDDPPVCPLKFRLFFFGLMLSSFGAGCVAAFLVRRAEASGHTKWACGYAIVNWIQAMLGSLGMTDLVEAHLHCADCCCISLPFSGCRHSSLHCWISWSNLPIGTTAVSAFAD